MQWLLIRHWKVNDLGNDYLYNAIVVRTDKKWKEALEDYVNSAVDYDAMKDILSVGCCEYLSD